MADRLTIPLEKGQWLMVMSVAGGGMQVFRKLNIGEHIESCIRQLRGATPTLTGGPRGKKGANQVKNTNAVKISAKKAENPAKKSRIN